MKLFRLITTPALLSEFIEENYISIVIPWLDANIEDWSWQQIIERFPLASEHEEFSLFIKSMDDGDLIMLTDQERLYVGDLGDYYYVANEQQSGKEHLPARHHRRGVTWIKAFDMNMIHCIEPLQQWLSSEAILSQYPEPISIEKFQSWITLAPATATVLASVQESHEKPSYSNIVQDASKPFTDAVASPSLDIPYTSGSGTSYKPTHTHTDNRLTKPLIDNALLEQAISILQQAMMSDDVERKERAAIALLQYASAQQRA